MVNLIKITWSLARNVWYIELLYLKLKKNCTFCYHMWKFIKKFYVFQKQSKKKAQDCILVFNQCELLYCPISKLCWDWFNSSCYVTYFLFLEWSCHLINNYSAFIHLFLHYHLDLVRPRASCFCLLAKFHQWTMFCSLLHCHFRSCFSYCSHTFDFVLVSQQLINICFPCVTEQNIHFKTGFSGLGRVSYL